MTEVNKWGRPTSYTPAIQKKADEYVKQCKDDYKEYVLNTTSTEKDYQGAISTETKTTKVNKLKVKLPTIEGLAKFIDVNRSTIYEWAKQKEYFKFSDTLQRLKEEQAERVINMTMSGDYNPTIAKLLLASHGYVEKQEIDQKTIQVSYTKEEWENMSDEELGKLIQE